MKIGWILQSHPSYSNYARATADLKQRIEIERAEIELSPHSISHTTANVQILRTQALKVATTVEQSENFWTD